MTTCSRTSLLKMRLPWGLHVLRMVWWEVSITEANVKWRKRYGLRAGIEGANSD